jgi:uncharacterized protein YggE
MKYSALLLLVLLIACNSTDRQKKIRVSGEGKVRIMPNLVILTIEIAFIKPRMADAVKQTQQTVDSVMMILEQFGRKDIDIKTSSISANKQYDYIGNKQVFAGFNAEQSIDFVLNDIQKFTELTGKLLETKINSISDIQFGHSKADSLFREADLLAYDDALKSATKLSNRANVRLGKLVYISNSDSGSGSDDQQYTPGNRINTYSKAYGGRGFKISPEVLEFKRNIISEYEITE